MLLPASTASHWYLSSSNRIYTDVVTDFSYDRWLEALRAGRTFITDGPVLRLRVAGQAPAIDLLELSAQSGTAEVVVEWECSQPVDRVEIVRDGAVV